MNFITTFLFVSCVKALNFSPSPVTQGKYFKLSCATNTTAEILHNGTLVTKCSIDADSCTSTEPAYYVSVEGGNIVLRTNKSDYSRDNGNWTCGSEQIVLDIKALSSVHINVSSTSINVIKGKYFAVNCVATGFIPSVPITGYTWIKNNQTIPGVNSNSYTFNPVETTDEGEFKCTANNGVEKVISGNLVQVVVIYPPVVTSNYENYKIQENSSGIVTCSAIAKPNDVTFKWNGPHNFGSDGPSLILTNIRRDKAGLYSCTANNSVGANTTKTTVDVLYGPEISIIPTLTTYKVQENMALSFKCSVSSNPSPDSFFWYNPDSVNLKTDKLVIPDVKRTQAGTYSCRATTTLHPTSGSAVSLNGSKSIFVDVSYLDPVKIEVSTLVVAENSKITIVCSTESRPEANMTLFNDNYTLIYLQNNTVTYTINEAQCLDTGIYSCEAKNLQAFQPSFEKSKRIEVLCSPRPDHRENITYTTFANKTDVITLKAFVIAFPPPIFIWYYVKATGGISIIKDDDTFTISTRKSSTIAFLSILTINITSDSLFNQYNLDVYNEISSTRMVYYVEEEGRSSKTDTGLIIGGVVSSFLVITVIVVLMVFLHRRKMKQIKKERKEETTYSDLNVDSRMPERNYQSLQDQPVPVEQTNCESKTYVNLENLTDDKTYANCNSSVFQDISEDSKDVYANYNKATESVYANV